MRSLFVPALLLALTAPVAAQSVLPEAESEVPPAWGSHPALPILPNLGPAATQNALSVYKVPAQKFPIQLGAVTTAKLYVGQSARFPSPMKGRWPEITGNYYRPRNIRPGERVPAAVIVHHLGGSFEIYDFVGKHLAQNGVATYVINLPNYGPRREEGTKQGFMRLPPLVVFKTFQQAVLDVIRAGDFLRSQPEVDPNRVGLMGLSLGAFVASVAKGVDPRLRRAMLILGGGDITQMFSQVPDGMKMIEKAGVTPEMLESILAPVEPLTFASRINPADVYMLNAEQDEIVPRASTDALWNALGRPKQRWINCGHYGVALHLMRVMNDALDHLKGRSLVLNSVREMDDPGPVTTHRTFSASPWLGALLLLIAAPCAAQEDLFLDPARDPVDAVGRSVKVTLTELTKTSSEQVFEDGEAMEMVRQRKIDTVWVQRVVEVTNRRATTLMLTFSTWSLRQGKREDTSLAGKAITFQKAGERFKWTAPEGVELSSAAKGFLEQRADRLARPLLAALLPAEKKAVFEGTTWTRHALKVSRAILPRAEPDPKRSKVTVKLASLEGAPPVAKVQAQASLQLNVLPGTTAKITEGGVWESGVELTWVTDRPMRDAESKHVARFLGSGEGEQPDGRRYTVKTDVEVSRVVKVEPVE